jgi:hypothetical protein
VAFKKRFPPSELQKYHYNHNFRSYLQSIPFFLLLSSFFCFFMTECFDDASLPANCLSASSAHTHTNIQNKKREKRGDGGWFDLLIKLKGGTARAITQTTAKRCSQRQNAFYKSVLKLNFQSFGPTQIDIMSS